MFVSGLDFSGRSAISDPIWRKLVHIKGIKWRLDLDILILYRTNA